MRAEEKMFLELFPNGVPVGTVVEIDGEEYLVGDININGGQCDCCSITGSIAKIKSNKITD